MNEKEFPEKNLSPEEEGLPQTPESPVDFSDLGPLFAPADVSGESSEEEVVFQPEEPEKEAEPEEAEEVIFEPVNPQEEIPKDSSGAVDFSDLGPLFSSGPAEVQPGQAAMVLKKLSELEPVTRQEVPEVQENKSPEKPDLEEDTLILPSSMDLPAETANEDVAEEEFSEIFQEENSSPEEENPQEEEPAEESGDLSPVELPSFETPEEGPEQVPGEEAPAEEETPSEEEEVSPAVEADTEPDAKPEKPRRTARKGRPKRKKGEGFFGIPNLLATVVWIAVTVLIGVTLGRMIWVCAADVLAFGKEDKPVTITIYEADTIEDITRKLHENGLIRYPGLFKFYASLAVDEGEIHPGIWDLNTRYDYHALVNMMSPSSSREVIELMIPEGYSCRQIFALMEENKICTALDLASYAAAGDLGDYWFLEEVPRGDMYCLEGFLFPDTYQFYKNDSPRNVLTKMLDNFNNKFDEAMVGQIDTLNVRLGDLMREGGHDDNYIAEHKFDVRDVINVASLIEKETSSADEGYVISSVIYNRLYNWGENIPYLNIDATIVYALGGKTKLTQEDLKVNSPYNTYTHTGLTPGPIANPGLSSIRAALDPSDSDYYFYVLDPALGSHRFSTTYEEHKANIASIGG